MFSWWDYDGTAIGDAQFDLLIVCHPTTSALLTGELVTGELLAGRLLTGRLLTGTVLSIGVSFRGVSLDSLSFPRLSFTNQCSGRLGSRLRSSNWHGFGCPRVRRLGSDRLSFTSLMRGRVPLHAGGLCHRRNLCRRDYHFRAFDSLEQLLGDGEITLCADGVHIVEQDRLAEAGGFRKPNVPWDRRAENLRTEILGRILCDLSAEIQPRVIHREQNATNGETWIDVLLHEANRVEQLRDSLQAIVLALDGDDERLYRCKHVQGQETERRRAVHHDVVVVALEGLEHSTQRRFAKRALDQLQLGTDEVLGRWQQREVRKAGYGQYDVLDRVILNQCVVQRELQLELGDANAAGGVPLRIGIDQERPAARDG
jgi:hypothetical protein